VENSDGVSVEEAPSTARCDELWREAKVAKRRYTIISRRSVAVAATRSQEWVHAIVRSDHSVASVGPGEVMAEVVEGVLSRSL
jgi:hypothetical protein